MLPVSNNPLAKDILNEQCLDDFVKYVFLICKRNPKIHCQSWNRSTNRNKKRDEEIMCHFSLEITCKLYKKYFC